MIEVGVGVVRMMSDPIARENTSKPVAITIPKGSGLTLREYKELSAKDHSTLTPAEQKQLAEAQEQLRKITETLASKYDFSVIAKAVEGIYKISPAIQSLQAIDTSPMLKIVADMQKTSLALQPALDKAFSIQETIAPAVEAIYKSSVFTQNQFAALAAIQKSLVTFPNEHIIASIKSIQDAFQAPLIARTMFADFHTAHERILRNLRFDVGSLTASIEFSRSETVNVILNDVSTDKDDLTATATATQTSSVGNVTFSDSANLLMAFNDLKQEVRELRQQLLAKDNQQGNLLIAPTAVHFQRTSSSIQIGPFKVAVTVSSKQTQFARVLLSTPENITKRWDIEDVIFEAFGERIANDEQDWISKIRSYIHQLNNKVLRDTNNTMPNFFILEGIEVYVNPDYINL
jgi:hypothetical protein